MSSLSQITASPAAAAQSPLDTLNHQVQRFVEERVLVNGPVDLPEPYKVAFFALCRSRIILCQTEEIPRAEDLTQVKQFYERAAANLSRELAAQGADRDTTVTVSAIFFKSLGEHLGSMRAIKAVCSASTHMKHSATYLPNVSAATVRHNLDSYFENYSTNHTFYDVVSRFFFGNHAGSIRKAP